MRKLWILTLGLVALIAADGCKRNAPEPIPGPKAVPALVGHARAAGIAWFQGSLDEAFARPSARVTCAAAERASMAPLGADLSRPLRNRLITSPPAACRSAPCPSAAAPRRPLV